MIDELISKHRSRGILVDANILLLHMIGGIDRDLIPRFKRTRKFEIEDYGTLQRLLGLFKQVVTTPNVLTEVNSLAGQLANTHRAGFMDVFRREISLLDERYLASAVVAEQSFFDKLGLSDGGIGMLAEDRLLVLTDDFPLANRLGKMGLDVLNFNHIRTMAWGWREQ